MSAVRVAFGTLGLVDITLGVVLLVWPPAMLMVVAGIAVPTWSALARVVFTGSTFIILGLVSVVRAFTFGKDSKVIDA